MNYITLILGIIVIITFIVFIKNYIYKIQEHFGFIKKAARRVKRGFKKAGKGVKKVAKKVGKGVKKAGKKITGGIKKAVDFIKDLPKKILKVLPSIINGMKNGITKGIYKAFDFVLTTIGKILETIFGPIFNPLMSYFWAIGIAMGLFILTCIGSAFYIYTRPSPQMGGSVKNNITLFSIIFILLVSIFIFSRKKIEHFGFLPKLKSVLDPIKKSFKKITKKISDAIKKILKKIKESTIDKLKKLIKKAIVEIQEFLKPILTGLAILPIIGIIIVIGGTIYFYGPDNKPTAAPATPAAPATTPAPPAATEIPATAPVSIPISIPISAPAAPAPAPTPVPATLGVVRGGKKNKK